MRITGKQYKNMGRRRKSKYGNKKTIIDGITFDGSEKPLQK